MSDAVHTETGILAPEAIAQAQAETRSAALIPLTAQAQAFISAAKAPATRKAYRSDWQQFDRWCSEHGLISLPASPETVTLYLAALAASHRPATLQRKLTSISKAHQAAGYPSPATMQHAAVSETLKGIRRTFGTAQPGKEPLLTADILKMLDSLPESPLGLRDRALLLIGYAGGFRRSELAAITVEDVAETADGLIIRLPRSKTDQEGQGSSVALPYASQAATCPVRCYRAWLENSGIAAGPVFRSIDRHGKLSEAALDSGSIARIVKRAAADAGLDPAGYAGHSLRAGFATQAFLNGAPELAIMRQTRHRSLATVRKYIRDRSLFRENPAAKLGL
ncbi:MAG: site-specific integrase [Bryobacteraceae bacterium]